LCTALVFAATPSHLLDLNDMPELPEVEHMRKILLCLKSPTEADDGRNKRVHILRVNGNPPRSFLSDEEIESLNQSRCIVADVTRKGKLLCLELECEKEVMFITTTGKDDDKTTTINAKKVYIFLHMGMTGRISSPNKILNLQELKEDTNYPPPSTYLTFKLVDQDTVELCSTKVDLENWHRMLSWKLKARISKGSSTS
jgi:formamidopyrimidine-DNA glycosylase